MAIINFLNQSPLNEVKKNMELLEKIKKIHKDSRGTYGSPRVHAELLEQGEQCSRKRSDKIMHNAGIQAKMKRRFKVTTKVNPKAQAAPNLLQQDFTASVTSQKI